MKNVDIMEFQICTTDIQMEVSSFSQQFQNYNQNMNNVKIIHAKPIIDTFDR